MEGKTKWYWLGVGLVSALVLCLGIVFGHYDVTESTSAESTSRAEAQPPETFANAPGGAPRYDNAVWMRRHWIHGGADLDERVLAERLVELGIRNIYPFLGPMDRNGEPGWRKDGSLQKYDAERAKRFFQNMQHVAPEVRVLPWTGGVLDRDVHLQDEHQREAFAAEMAKITELGADGIHINVEPMPSNEPGYLELLEATKSAIGSDKTLSIAAYPPQTDLHPYPDVHWTYEFTKEVCMAADELAFMGYDTALREPAAYIGLMAEWTRELIEKLPSPEAGGCEIMMGVPAYEDDRGYHRPRIENIEHGIAGVNRGLSQLEEIPEHFRGIAVYSSWTTDSTEWTTYQQKWRGTQQPVRSTLPDFAGGDG